MITSNNVTIKTINNQYFNRYAINNYYIISSKVLLLSARSVSSLIIKLSFSGALITLSLTNAEARSPLGQKCLTVAGNGVVRFLKRDKRQDVFLQVFDKNSAHINDRKTNNALYYFTMTRQLKAPDSDVNGYLFSNLKNKIVVYIEEKGCKMLDVRAL